MKRVLLVLISVMFTTLLFSEETKPKKDANLCKIFQDKIKKYKKDMRNDEYAILTLMS